MVVDIEAEKAPYCTAASRDVSIPVLVEISEPSVSVRPWVYVTVSLTSVICLKNIHDETNGGTGTVLNVSAGVCDRRWHSDGDADRGARNYLMISYPLTEYQQNTNLLS